MRLINLAGFFERDLNELEAVILDKTSPSSYRFTDQFRCRRGPIELKVIAIFRAVNTVYKI